MNIYLIIILAIIIGEYLLDLIVGALNVAHASPVLPGEFEGYFDQGRYRKAQGYLREKTFFEICRNTATTSIMLLFILLGGFNAVDDLARSLDQNYIITGLIFAGILSVAMQALNAPFSAYNTFVIEGKYGFNKTTPATFISDFLKRLSIGAVIGAVIFSSVLWLFYKTDKTAWIYCWAAVTLFQVFL